MKFGYYSNQLCARTQNAQKERKDCFLVKFLSLKKSMQMAVITWQLSKRRKVMSDNRNPCQYGQPLSWYAEDKGEANATSK